MAKLIKSEGLKQREFINKYFENRTIRKNKNVIGITTGQTGSGKTYSQLSMAEGWYEYQFNQEFPIGNVAFSLGALIKKINELQVNNKLRKGETFVLEETGANFGNLDFQKKLSKMFSYILQSFRSMNLILLMNVPIFTMINKSARQLVHFQMNTKSIDYETKTCKVSCKMHQINEQSGKSYWKYPRARINGKMRTIERFTFPKPSERLIQLYEKEKLKFVTDLTQEFIEEAHKIEYEKELKMSRKELASLQQYVFEGDIKGLSTKEMATERGCTYGNITNARRDYRKKGFKLPISLEKKEKTLLKPILPSLSI